MNIDKIEVTENDRYLEIYPNKNIVIIEGKPYEIKTEDIRELLRIIRNWDNAYYSSKGIDGNRFEVVVYSKGEKTIMRGLRKLPDNYDSFVSLVRSIYGRV